MAHLGVDDIELIEAQQPAVTSPAPDHASGGQTQETIVAHPEPGGHASRTSVNSNRGIDPNDPAPTSQVVGEGRDDQGASVHQPEPNMLRRRRPRHRILAMCKKVQSDLEPDNPPTANTPVDGSSEADQGDFDDGANTLWTLYGKEAKEFDEAHIQTLKDDMDSILLFAGLFAATLTGFIIDAKQDLKASTAEQMVYYQKQNVEILAQISQQISSIPQVVIPSIQLQPYPDFHPSSSALRVNVFLFMALVFSLFAALLAILVQQWVRRYMRIFQQHNDPLKRARLRQYLHEGVEKWHMPLLAEGVPSLFHTALALFFLGIADSVLNLNKTLGLSIIIPIGISGSFYVFTAIVPVFDLQAPYHHSTSGLIWYTIQWLRGRKPKNPGPGGKLKSMGSNMAEGQMEVAMGETGREARDERAVSWLVKKLTEDADMEPFVMAIPGSFNTEWGKTVLKGVSEAMEEPNENQVTIESRNPSTPSAPVHTPEECMRELSRRVGHLLETCINRSHFASTELWRKRARGCVEAIADLVVRGDADLEWFGKIGRPLGSIGAAEKINISEGLDQSFVSPWTCLSIMAIRRAMCEPNSSVRTSAEGDLIRLASLQGEEELQVAERSDRSVIDERVLQVAEKVDNDFKWAWECLRGLRSSLFDGPELTASESQVKLDSHEKEITELEDLRATSNDMIQLDKYIADAWRKTHKATQELTSQLPGVRFDAPLTKSESLTFNDTLRFLADPFKPLSLLPGRQLRGLCSLAPRLRNIINGRNVESLQETLDSLRAVPKVEDWLHLEYLMEDQLARLQDLRDSGGFGLAVELFFVTLEKMLPTYPLEESQHDLYLSTFRRITYDWEKCRGSLGTQKVILGVVRDLAMRLARDEVPLISDFVCPEAFIDGLLGLLRNMLAGTTAQLDHIARAASTLTPFRSDQGMRGKFVKKVLEVLPSSDSELSSS